MWYFQDVAEPNTMSSEIRSRTGQETFVSKARKAVRSFGDKLRANSGPLSSPQLAGEAAGLVIPDSVAPAEDPKLANTFQRTMHPVTAPAAPGTRTAPIPETRQVTGVKDKKKHHIVRNVVLGTTGVVTAVSGGLAVQHHIEYGEPLNPQAIERDVASVPGGWWNLEQSLQNNISNKLGIRTVPSSFDNNISDIKVQAGVNATPISPEQSLTFFNTEIKPVSDPNEIARVDLPFPVKLTQGDKIVISKEVVSQAYNPFTQKPETMEFGREITIVRSGTEIALNVREAEIFQIAPAIVDGKEYFGGLVMRFTGQDGFQYELTAQDRVDLRQLGPSDVVKDAPSLGENGSYIYGYKNQEKTDKKGVIVKGGTTILRTATANAKITYELRRIDPVSGTSVKVPFDFNLDQNNNLLFSPSQQK